MELLDYIRKNYKTPNVAVLKTLGATNELIKYLVNTPNNTNIKVVESLINKDDESDEGNGIKSITISPAITTTPAFASLFPIYWEDLTEKQKQEHVVRIAASTQATMEVGDTYTVTVVPTADMYAMGDSEFGGKGEPVTYISEVTDFTDGNAMEIEIYATNQLPPSAQVLPPANAMYFSVILRIG